MLVLGLVAVRVSQLLVCTLVSFIFFFSSRRRHTRWPRDWSSDVCSSDLADRERQGQASAADLRAVVLVPLAVQLPRGRADRGSARAVRRAARAAPDPADGDARPRRPDGEAQDRKSVV